MCQELFKVASRLVLFPHFFNAIQGRYEFSTSEIDLVVVRVVGILFNEGGIYASDYGITWSIDSLFRSGWVVVLAVLILLGSGEDQYFLLIF